MASNSPSNHPQRSAKEVIDAAIEDSRGWERVCLGLMLIFAAGGISLLILGALRDDWGIAGTGAGSVALFAPSLWAAMHIRQTNIRVRLLEIPLQKAKTAEEAARIIEGMFRPTRGNSNASP